MERQSVEPYERGLNVIVTFKRNVTFHADLPMTYATVALIFLFIERLAFHASAIEARV